MCDDNEWDEKQNKTTSKVGIIFSRRQHEHSMPNKSFSQQVCHSYYCAAVQHLHQSFSSSKTAASSSYCSSRIHEARVSVVVRSACVGLTLEPFVHRFLSLFFIFLSSPCVPLSQSGPFCLLCVVLSASVLVQFCFFCFASSSFFRFLSAIQSPFCFPGVRSDGVRIYYLVCLFSVFASLFYYRGISYTPELFIGACPATTDCLCIVL